MYEKSVSLNAKAPTTSAHKNVGATNLTEVFGNISLSPEVKEFLATLGARLVVSYSSGSTKPELEILDRRNEIACSIDEFMKLGGFRRFVNDALKTLEKEQSSSEKIKLAAYFLRIGNQKKYTFSERLDEGNETKLRQFHSMIKIIVDHLEAIEQTVDSTVRTYLMEKGRALVNILYKLMLECFKPEKIEKEELFKRLFACTIPKWLYNKLTDKQFTGNLKADATSLLYPKGNYLKSIGFTTTEMHDEAFLAGNKEILSHSGAIVALAQTDWSMLKPNIPKQLEADVDKSYAGIMWTLNSPYEDDVILGIRVWGKAPPAFKARQMANPKLGSKTWPETEAQRLCRLCCETSNTIGMLQATFLHFQNFIVPLANPLRDFWSGIIPGTDAWEITPTHNLYEHIKEVKPAQLAGIRKLSNAGVLAIIGRAICQDLKILPGSLVGKKIISTIEALKDKPSFTKKEEAREIDIAEYDVNMESMKMIPLSNDDIEKAKKFLCASSSKKEKKKEKYKFGPSSVRVSTAALKELEVIAGSKILKPVKEWIASSFKVGNRNKTQMIAAQCVVDEVLKYQDKLLDEEFNEFKILEMIEDYEE